VSKEIYFDNFGNLIKAEQFDKEGDLAKEEKLDKKVEK